MAKGRGRGEGLLPISAEGLHGVAGHLTRYAGLNRSAGTGHECPRTAHTYLITVHTEPEITLLLVH